ncbi:MAG: hypothetical protein A2V75_00285 [Actinobacteria bacterium RBG_16_70_17]|nr:MAG: hypothetical protein A2V75_00285 [Actinobacteria bacterium RBG_16_70_17]
MADEREGIVMAESKCTTVAAAVGGFVLGVVVGKLLGRGFLECCSWGGAGGCCCEEEQEDCCCQDEGDEVMAEEQAAPSD